MDLTARQKSFCEYYAASGNAAAAARQAGYSARYANRQAAQLLKNPCVAEYIDKLAVDAAAVRFSTIDERRELLTKVARAPFLENGLRADISHSEINAAIRAIDLLNKMDGVYLQKVEVAGNGSPLPVTIRWEKDRADGAFIPFSEMTDSQLEKFAEDGNAADDDELDEIAAARARVAAASQN